MRAAQRKLSAMGSSLTLGDEVVRLPTASQVVAETHDTALSVAPARFGPLCSVQLVPFQASARVVPPGWPSVDVPEDPTASQADAEAHDTLFSPPIATVGVFWMVQVLPSQPSARPEPTASHVVGEGQETLVRAPPVGRLGVVWMLQVLPSHRSASGTLNGLET